MGLTQIADGLQALISLQRLPEANLQSLHDAVLLLVGLFPQPSLQPPKSLLSPSPEDAGVKGLSQVLPLDSFQYV